MFFKGRDIVPFLSPWIFTNTATINLFPCNAEDRISGLTLFKIRLQVQSCKWITQQKRFLTL
jgi:hypothetical protein